MKYGIALFPSKATQDEINSYRKRYDPHYALIPPHITIKEAFDADDNTIESYVHELKLIANETKPFAININKVSTFAPVTNTIYMKVEQTDTLRFLHDSLHQGRLPKEKRFQFIPHITIAQKLSHGEYSDVFGSMNMKDIHLEDTIDRFQLLYQLENGSWTVYETFVFGKEKI